MKLASDIIATLLTIFAVLIVARAMLAWLRPAPGGFLSRMGQMLVKVTEPYLRMFRHFIPISRLGMSAPHDFSVLVALLLLYVVIHVLIAV